MKRTGNLALYALTMAASGASLLIIRVTETFGRGSIFCSSTSCFVESVLWSLPGYAALLAVVMTTALMAAALVRERVGPPVVRIAALLAAVAGAIGYVVAAVVTLDFAWAGAFSGQLSPRPTALLPPILVTFAPSLLTLSFDADRCLDRAHEPATTAAACTAATRRPRLGGRRGDGRAGLVCPDPRRADVRSTRCVLGFDRLGFVPRDRSYEAIGPKRVTLVCRGQFLTARFSASCDVQPLCAHASGGHL